MITPNPPKGFHVHLNQNSLRPNAVCLLASDRGDHSSELVSILQSVGEGWPPFRHLKFHWCRATTWRVSWWTSICDRRKSVQMGPQTGCGPMPIARCRGLFVSPPKPCTMPRCRPGPLGANRHDIPGHSMPRLFLQRIRAAFPDSAGYDATDNGITLKPGCLRGACGDHQDVRKASGGSPAEVRGCPDGRRQDHQGPSSTPRCGNG